MNHFSTRERLDTGLHLLRNQEDVFVKQGHYYLFMHFPKS